MERPKPSSYQELRPKADVVATAAEHVRFRESRLKNPPPSQEQNNQGVGVSVPILLGQDSDPRGKENVIATAAEHVHLRQQKKP